MTSSDLDLSYPSQPHPEPWIATALALNFSINVSNDPKLLLIAATNSPLGGSPPPLLVGARLVQKIEWLTWPPPLNLIAELRAIISAISFFCSAAWYFSKAALRLLT